MTRHFAILTRIFILSTESRTQKVVQISTHTKAWISILQHTELLSSQCRKLSHARRVPPSRQGFQGREEGHFALPHYLSLAMDVSSKTHRSFFFSWTLWTADPQHIVRLPPGRAMASCWENRSFWCTISPFPSPSSKGPSTSIIFRSDGTLVR